MKNTNTMVPNHRYLQPPTNTDLVCLCQLASLSSIMTFTYISCNPWAAVIVYAFLRCVHVCCYQKTPFQAGCGEMFEGRPTYRLQASNCDQTYSISVSIISIIVHIVVCIYTSTILYESSITHTKQNKCLPGLFRINTYNKTLCRSNISDRFHIELFHMVNAGNARGWDRVAANGTCNCSIEVIVYRYRQRRCLFYAIIPKNQNKNTLCYVSQVRIYVNKFTLFPI